MKKIEVHKIICLPILDSINDGIVVLDQNLHILFWNKWMAFHTYYDSGAVTDRSLTEVLPEVKDSFLYFSILQSAETGLSQYHSYHFLENWLNFSSGISAFKKNSKLLVEIYIIPVKIEGKSVTLLQIRDVTNSALREQSLLNEISKNIKIEGELHESEFLYKTLAENADELIVIIDIFRKIRYVSPSFERILGYKRENFLNGDITDFMDAKDGKKLMDIMKNYSDYDYSRIFSHKYLFANGRSDQFTTSIKPVKYSEGSEGNIFMLISKQSGKNKKRRSKSVAEE